MCGQISRAGIVRQAGRNRNARRFWQPSVRFKWWLLIVFLLVGAMTIVNGIGERNLLTLVVGLAELPAAFAVAWFQYRRDRRRDAG